MSKNLFFKIDVEVIQGGMIPKLGGVKHFSVLTAIASFANSKGEAFPSQDKIGELVGYSRKTVNQIIRELRDVNAIKIVQEKTPKGRRNKYIISQEAGLWFGTKGVTNSTDNVTEEGNGVVNTSSQELEPYELEPRNENQEQDIFFENAKSVLDYFQQKYFETYSTTFQPNYARDNAMIKKKLLANYTDSEIKKIVDTVFVEYGQRWGNPKFPRPSIGQICSWLANKALAVAQEKEKEANEAEENEKKYEIDEDGLSSRWDLI